MEGESGNVQITRIENTKESLAVYKELIAVSWEFLTWKHEWYSILLVVAVTSVYSLIWWNDITVLSALSLLGIAAVCLDLICMHGRGFLATLIPWSNAREREYTDFCIWVSEGSTKVTSAVGRVARFRESNPLIYYAGAATVLLICAWIGSSVPNMLLCYWATVALVLAPGIVRNGLIAKYFAQVYVELHKLLRRYLPAKKSAGNANKEE